jgi:hypothetical protein
MARHIPYAKRTAPPYKFDRGGVLVDQRAMTTPVKRLDIVRTEDGALGIVAGFQRGDDHGARIKVRIYSRRGTCATLSVHPRDATVIGHAKKLPPCSGRKK